MGEATGLTLRRYQVVPPPRRQMAALKAGPGEAGGNRVESAEVVEQPAVYLLAPECRLDRRHIQVRTSTEHRYARHGSSISLRDRYFLASSFLSGTRCFTRTSFAVP